MFFDRALAKWRDLRFFSEISSSHTPSLAPEIAFLPAAGFFREMFSCSGRVFLD
jgi:hypothetical protein